MSVTVLLWPVILVVSRVTSRQVGNVVLRPVMLVLLRVASRLTTWFVACNVRATTCYQQADNVVIPRVASRLAGHVVLWPAMFGAFTSYQQDGWPRSVVACNVGAITCYQQAGRLGTWCCDL